MNRLDTPAWCCISDSDGRWYSTIWCYSGVKETESNALYFLCSLARENIFAFLDDPATGDVSAGIQIPYSCMTSESSSHYFTYVVSATSKPAPQTESPHLLVLYVYPRRSFDTRYRSASGILKRMFNQRRTSLEMPDTLDCVILVVWSAGCILHK